MSKNTVPQSSDNNTSYPTKIEMHRMLDKVMKKWNKHWDDNRDKANMNTPDFYFGAMQFRHFMMEHYDTLTRTIRGGEIYE